LNQEQFVRGWIFTIFFCGLTYPKRHMALLQVKGLIIFSLWCRQALARLEVDAHQRVFRGGLKDQEVQSVLVSRKTTRQRI